MPERIEIRGVIVGAEWDTDWMQEYIERGLLTPESRIRRAFAAADGDVDVYVNSPGGSVFAGYEMVNAALDYMRDTGRKVSVTVGGLAASMAAVFAVMVGRKFRVHANSKLMFHGAWGDVIGGEEAMRDEAELIGKINAELKTRLVGAYDLSPDVVDEWFREGRMGWLSADDAMAAGMVSEIIGEDDDLPRIDQDTADMLQSRGMQLAAMIETMDAAAAAAGEGGDASDDPGTAGDEDGDGEPDAGADDARAEAVAELRAKLQEMATSHAAEVAGLNAEIAELRETVTARDLQIEAMEQAATDAADAADALRAEYERKLGELESRYRQLSAGFRGGEGEPADWPAAVKRETDAGRDYDAAMVAAQRKWPGLHRDYIERANQKGR